LFGRLVGLKVGFAVGVEVGLALGLAVGLFDGLKDGRMDGEVGGLVCLAHGRCTGAWALDIGVVEIMNRTRYPREMFMFLN
jgi:hypothetical protein